MESHRLAPRAPALPVTVRHQLPAWSPLTLRGAIAGLGAAHGAADVRRAVGRTLGAAFAADALALTSSGTGALTLAIRTCLAGGGGAVALPAYGCYDLATAADGARVPVLLYDVDPATLAPATASLARALEGGARAVVLVHLFGVPVDPAPVLDLARRAGAWLIEDAAQAAGATLRGVPAGSFGDLTVLSFGRGKGTTGGRGGALLARGGRAAPLLEAARSMTGPARGAWRELVPLVAQWLLGRPSLYGIPSALPFLRLGETIYHPPAPVLGMSDVAVATLSRTLPLVAAELARRRGNAARLLQQSGRHQAVTPPAGAEPGWLRLPLVVADAARRAAIAARALGIMGGYPLALCDLPGFADRAGNRGDAFPGARTLAASLITLPTHGLLSGADLEHLERWLARW